MKKSKIKKSNSPYLKILFAILIIGALGYYTISRQPRIAPQPLDINELAASAATVTLSLPTNVVSNPGSDSTIDITIDTGSSLVAAAQIELTYDPTMISTPTLIQGDFLTDKLGNPKIGNGKISFVYTAPLGSGGKSGSGKIATLKFKPISGDSQIKFTNNTVIAAIGLNMNALSSATGTTIQTTSNASPVTPPVLADIVPIPTLAAVATTTVSNTTPPKQSASSPKNQATQTEQLSEKVDARSFDESGNFDYTNPSTNINVIESDNQPPQANLGLVAKFLALIKSIFGDKHVTN